MSEGERTRTITETGDSSFGGSSQDSSCDAAAELLGCSALGLFSTVGNRPNHSLTGVAVGLFE
jgi:hypothetical protein